MADQDKPKRCTVCDGRGYHFCACWPGDCICGWGDQDCEECEGHGFFFPDEHYDPQYEEWLENREALKTPSQDTGEQK